MDYWPYQGYLVDNVDGRLLDPNKDTGNDIYLKYDDDRVGDRSSTTKQQDLDFHDIEDSSETVERGAQIAIAEQTGEGRLELVASFFEDTKKIKDQTYKI